MSYPEPLADPLADLPDVPPTDPREPEGKETDIPADDTPPGPDHEAVWPTEEA